MRCSGGVLAAVMAAALAASPACAAGATVPAESTVANISRAYPLSLALDDNSELRWRVDHSETPGDNTATIHMLMELRRSAWLGLGFSPTGLMVGPPASDVVIGQPLTGTVLQYHLTAKRMSGIEPDMRQDLVGARRIWQQAGRTYMTFARQLDTGDPNDVVIVPNTEMRLIFAYGAEGQLGLTPHDQRGAVAVNLDSGCGTSQETENLQRTKSLHGLTMFFGWCMFVFLGIVSARYFRHHKRWLHYHRLFMSIGTAGTVSGAVLAVSFGSREVSSDHAVLGLCLASVTWVQASCGSWVHSFRKVRPVGVRDVFVDTVALIHVWNGKLLFCLALVNIALGIEQMGLQDELANPYQYVVGWLLLMLFVLEIRLWRNRRVEQSVGLSGAHRRRLSAMFATNGPEPDSMALRRRRIAMAHRFMPTTVAELAEFTEAHGVPDNFVSAAMNVAHLRSAKSRYLVPLVLSTRVGLRNAQEVDSLCKILGPLKPIRHHVLQALPKYDPLLRDLAQSASVIHVGLKEGGVVVPGKAPTALGATLEAPSALPTKLNKLMALNQHAEPATDGQPEESSSGSDVDESQTKNLLSLGGASLGIRPPLEEMPTATISGSGRFNLCPFVVLQGRITVAVVDMNRIEVCRNTFDAGQANAPVAPLRTKVVDVTSDAVALVLGSEEWTLLANRHASKPGLVWTALMEYLDLPYLSKDD